MRSASFGLALRSTLPWSTFIRPVAQTPLFFLARLFTTSPLLLKKPLPPRPKPPPEDEIEEVFVKGSGPGGQKINKTNSAVQIKHIPTGIVVKSQATRSRSENRAIARKVLAQRLDELYNGEQSRTAIVGHVKRKKRASADKKSRRKYRKLEEEKQQDDVDGAVEGERSEAGTGRAHLDTFIVREQSESPSEPALEPSPTPSRADPDPTKLLGERRE
ncbi:hypothetical protein jhhlp_002586 [Lomentospora prolificans]|uniref:Prokaryotic-type class I peptide chain release factors domain-containing protein n=1 Tax=Lomentospora prolificans TaxID=41688 RepID=A0A2N3NEH3_9PEZI|nr:hypothetical protein jhhlp_002586 [Lomentospora prolificans]